LGFLNIFDNLIASGHRVWPACFCHRQIPSVHLRTHYQRKANFYLPDLRKISSRFNDEFPEDQIHILFTRVQALYVKAVRVGKLIWQPKKKKNPEQNQSGRFTVGRIDSVKKTCRKFPDQATKTSRKKRGHELRAPST
jgi:hypothetical protein